MATEEEIRQQGMVAHTYNPTVKRLRQEDHRELEATLSYIARSFLQIIKKKIYRYIGITGLR